MNHFFPALFCISSIGKAGYITTYCMSYALLLLHEFDKSLSDTYVFGFVATAFSRNRTSLKRPPSQMPSEHTSDSWNCVIPVQIDMYTANEDICHVKKQLAPFILAAIINDDMHLPLTEQT